MHVLDSHTGGEPTRVILDGGPDLCPLQGSGDLASKAKLLATKYKDFYKSVLLEPRGQPAMVGALLTEPVDPSCVTGVIYFDAAAVIGMCGHGTIGLAVTLAHLGRIDIGIHRIETPVGVVTFELIDKNTVKVTNVESSLTKADVELDVPDYGRITGSIAYGGNVFFIVDPSPVLVEKSNIGQLTKLAHAIQDAAYHKGVQGKDGLPIDHIILQQRFDKGSQTFGRNFVLCPDGSFDRSPCGTGCSAILACLAANGELEEGQKIIQESIIGSPYELSYQKTSSGGVIPSIKGQAWVTAESKLLFDENDPFAGGVFYD